MRHLGDDWFAQPIVQELLLLYANTARGRDQLCIRDDVPKGRSIVDIRRNSYTVLANQKIPGYLGARAQVLAAKATGRPLELTTDFRCRSKFAYRLHALEVMGKLAHEPLGAYMKWRRRGYPYIPLVGTRYAHAASSTFYPDPHPESTSVDGFANESTAAAWTVLLDDVGSTGNSNGVLLYATYFVAYGAGSDWRYCTRSFLLFDTSAITVGTVTNTTLSVEGGTKADPGSNAPTTNIFAATPASNTDIVAGDYARRGSTPFATAVTYAAWQDGSYNDFVFNADGRAAVDVAGVSKFSMMNENFDVNVVEPARGGTTYMRGDSADVAGTASDPKLVVTFTTGSLSHVNLMMLGVG